MKIFTINVTTDQLKQIKTLMKVYNGRSEVFRTAIHQYLEKRIAKYTIDNEKVPIPTEGLVCDQPFLNPALFVTVPGMTTFKIVKKESRPA